MKYKMSVQLRAVVFGFLTFFVISGYAVSGELREKIIDCFNNNGNAINYQVQTTGFIITDLTSWLMMIVIVCLLTIGDDSKRDTSHWKLRIRTILGTPNGSVNEFANVLRFFSAFSGIALCVIPVGMFSTAVQQRKKKHGEKSQGAEERSDDERTNTSIRNSAFAK